MTTSQPSPAAPDALAAALAPDLVAIIGDLVTQIHDPAELAAVTGGARPGVGAVQVRLSGERADIDTVLAVLARACEVLDQSGPRRNRYDPGERVYLTVRTGPAPTKPDHRS